ncbi:MAG TPA: VWA domain-containing protein [Thermoanaerobaculia bacterium]|nr:VWA domain-containing protein [Thermoanaerobaculia bacterium]
MRAPRGWCSSVPRALLLAVVTVAAWSAAPVPAQNSQNGQTAQAGVQISFQSPIPDTPLFGEIDLLVDVVGAPVLRVEFFLDGRKVGSVGRPPYQVRVDVGQENREHRIEAVAHTMAGSRTSAVLVAPPVIVNEEVSVALRQLFVTVLEGGRRILDLDRAAFRVVDEGAEQQIVTFERGEVPFNAVLLLDTSESMKGERLDAARAGARAFLSGMREVDEASLILFSDRLLAAVPFTSDRAALGQALETTEAEGGTAVNDHLYLGLKVLDGQVGRGVVVLLSDGYDVQSVLGMKEVLWKARRSQALVYWLRLRDKDKGDERAVFSSAWRDFTANGEEYEVLERAVLDSGGRIEDITAASQIEPAFREILAELREQYVLGYYPSNARGNGSWHEVKVRVRGTGKVRVRGGYVDR